VQKTGSGPQIPSDLDLHQSHMVANPCWVTQESALVQLWTYLKFG